MPSHVARWAGRLGALPTAEPRAMGRTGALLFAPGGILVLATIPLLGAGADARVLAVTGCVALLTAVGLWFLGHRIPAHVYPAITMLGSAMIITIVEFGGQAGQGYAFLFVWVLIFAFYFYELLQAALQAIVVAEALLAFGTTTRMEWLLAVGTVIVAGTWMRMVVAALSRSEQSFRVLFADNPEPMWVYDRHDLRFLAVNNAALARYGYTRDEFLSMRITDIRPAEDVPALLAGGMVDADELGTPKRLWRHRRKDGSILDVEIYSHRQRFDGHDAKIVLVVDVTDRVRLEQQLRYQAFHDPLTDLANRSLFYDRVHHAQARRARDLTPISVLLIDLDGFKAVNDSFGHACGDEVLVEVARRITRALRPGDTPAHIGGDEFAVLLEGADGPQACVVGGRILEALRAPFVVATTEIFVTASIGAATMVGASEGELIRNADVAMYSAKRAGKNCCELFDSSMHSKTRLRLEMFNQLRRAVQHDEFIVEYQPIVRLSDQAVLGVEALVRWSDASRGLIPPSAFIPFAEETGMIVSIGQHVLESACRQVKEWQTTHGAGHLFASVNVSARQLREPDFASVVERTLASTGLDPAHLMLEITETALVDDMAATSEMLSQLRAIGVRIAIDDFGAGYSSLAYLRGLAVDVIKIDRVFIRGLGSDDGSGRELAIAIVRLIDTLPVRTVVEGIETPHELDYAKALGVDAAQGYLICRPMAADRVGEFIANAGSKARSPREPLLRVI